MNAHQMMEFHTGWPCLCHRCGSFMLRVCRTLCTASLSCFVVLNVSCTIAAGDISCHWDHGFSATDVAAPTSWNYQRLCVQLMMSCSGRVCTYICIVIERYRGRSRMRRPGQAFYQKLLMLSGHAITTNTNHRFRAKRKPSLTARRGRGSTCQQGSTA